MYLATIQKFGGVSLISGSLLLTIYAILVSIFLPIQEARTNFILLIHNQNWIGISLVALLGIIMMIFGFMAVYSRIYLKSGLLGFIGFLFVEIAYILQLSKVTWEVCLYPIIAVNQSSAVLFTDLIIFNNPIIAIFKTNASITIIIGVILFCTAIIRSKEFPMLAGGSILAGALIYGLGPILSTYIAIAGILIHSVGCLIVGFNLMRSKEVKETQSNVSV